MFCFELIQPIKPNQSPKGFVIVSEKSYTRIFEHHESHSITFVSQARIGEIRKLKELICFNVFKLFVCELFLFWIICASQIKVQKVLWLWEKKVTRSFLNITSHILICLWAKYAFVKYENYNNQSRSVSDKELIICLNVFKLFACELFLFWIICTSQIKVKKVLWLWVKKSYTRIFEHHESHSNMFVSQVRICGVRKLENFKDLRNKFEWNKVEIFYFVQRNALPIKNVCKRIVFGSTISEVSV